MTHRRGRSRPLSGAGFAVMLLAMLVPGSAGADEPPKRPVIVGITIGARFFNDDLELGNDFAFGGRVGMGLSPRWALITDFIACHPSRDKTAIAAYVDALRFMARYNFKTGTFRPYAIGGIGGVLFIFNDTPTTSGGALTAGLGADYRVAPQTRLFVEATRDLYSEQDITYDIEGNPVYTGDEHTKALGTICTGISVEF
jgi:opacity protein-like surface antigen